MPQINPHTVGRKRSGPEGKIFTIQKPNACKEAGIPYVSPPHGVAGHKIVVLSRPDHENMVAIATITTKVTEGSTYFPIVPAPGSSCGWRIIITSISGRAPGALPARSYLRAERHHVRFEMLEEVGADFEGLGQLRLNVESTRRVMGFMRDEPVVGRGG